MTKPVSVALAISKHQISSNMSRIRISGFSNNKTVITMIIHILCSWTVFDRYTFAGKKRLYNQPSLDENDRPKP